ncbi:hypothetical protein FH972_005515 [Carpinus fangiana]|uniref:Uncharacterized protein n=1 Tax=Carpinus fangiana TaxID=176857 RepID=A0A5N6QRB7_9ROSI|nr:hypothetical protein FH972_005515 [Carpinus fangiana]
MPTKDTEVGRRVQATRQHLMTETGWRRGRSAKGAICSKGKEQGCHTRCGTLYMLSFTRE